MYLLAEQAHERMMPFAQRFAESYGILTQHGPGYEKSFGLSEVLLNKFWNPISAVMRHTYPSGKKPGLCTPTVRTKPCRLQKLFLCTVICRRRKLSNVRLH